MQLTINTQHKTTQQYKLFGLKFIIYCVKIKHKFLKNTQHKNKKQKLKKT